MIASFPFLTSRRFLPLFGTQFLGAFNDNLLKTAIVVLISYRGLSIGGMSPAMLVNLAAGLFILPFFLFSATAGKLSEKIDKARIARAVKLVEIAIMLLAGVGFFLHAAGLLLTALFLMGVHSAFFGPLKYSILPQYLNDRELVGGNGLIEMGTFLAILIGQIGGSLMTQGGPWLIVTMIAATALAGYACSRQMPPAPPSTPELKLSANVLKDSVELVGKAWRIADVKSAILGISWFWLMGAIYTTQLPTFTKLHLGGDANVYTLMLALFSIGIGAGSVICAKLSQGRLQLGLVLVGSVGMTVTGVDVALSSLALHQGELVGLGAYLAMPANWRHIADIALLGFFGGFFTVPLYTWLQIASPTAFRSQAIAANNITNGFYMVLSAIASAVILKLSDSVAVLLLVTASANVLATWHLVRCAPSIWHSRFSWLRPVKS